jgi:hypothetical protein
MDESAREMIIVCQEVAVLTVPTVLHEVVIGIGSGVTACQLVMVTQKSEIVQNYVIYKMSH